MADLDASYRKTLQQEYQRRVAKNPRYSRAAYARFLGVDATYLSKLLSGKILLSLEAADAMARKLNLGTDERSAFLLSVAEEHKCHALYLVDPSLTGCDPDEREVNLLPKPRKKWSKY